MKHAGVVVVVVSSCSCFCVSAETLRGVGVGGGLDVANECSRAVVVVVLSNATTDDDDGRVGFSRGIMVLACVSPACRRVRCRRRGGEGVTTDNGSGLTRQ